MAKSWREADGAAAVHLEAAGFGDQLIWQLLAVAAAIRAALAAVVLALRAVLEARIPQQGGELLEDHASRNRSGLGRHACM